MNVLISGKKNIVNFGRNVPYIILVSSTVNLSLKEWISVIVSQRRSAVALSEWDALVGCAPVPDPCAPGWWGS